MKKIYDVVIIETRRKTILTMANSIEEANNIVETRYEQGHFDFDEVFDTDFEVIEERRIC